MAGVLLLTLALAVGEPPAATSGEENAHGVVPIVAGAAAAGVVGGALVAVPGFFSVLASWGPWVALPLSFGVIGAGAAFGGFIGALGAARVPTALVVGSVAGAGAILGGVAGASVGAGIGTSLGPSITPDAPGGTGLVVGGLLGAAVGAIAGSAGAGAGGALWLIRDPLES